MPSVTSQYYLFKSNKDIKCVTCDKNIIKSKQHYSNATLFSDPDFRHIIIVDLGACSPECLTAYTVLRELS